jgi:shikimate kinase
MNVVLIGMKHCGKSTIGRALAARWQCPFYDVDELIEYTHECETERRQTVREIFAEHGEKHFHRIEGHVVCELYLKLDRPGSNAVVSLGGRTALNSTISALLQPIGLVAYLRVPSDELYARIERSGLPAFLDAANPKEHFFRLCREREPEYEQLANVIVDIEHLGIEEAVELLERRIQGHPPLP